MDIEQAERIAIELFDKHGLLDAKWCFEFDNAKRRFGQCRYTDLTITLSKHLVSLNEEAKVTDTILHEIAHALVGAGHGHNHVWRRKAIEIGCDGKRCYSVEVVRPKGNYEAICETCKRKYIKFKNPKRGYSCGKCSKGFNPNAILIWEKVEKDLEVSN